MKWDFRYVDPYQCVHHKVYFPKAYKYAKLMERGDKFPPIQIHLDKHGRYIVKNGAHRTFAAKLAGMKVFIKIKSTYYDVDPFEEHYK